METIKKQTNYGYVRVSTREQNEDRQIIAIKEMGKFPFENCLF